jgi:hypothetical protein
MWFSRAVATISSSYPFFELRAYRLVNKKKRQINAIILEKKKFHHSHMSGFVGDTRPNDYILPRSYNNSPAERQ